MPSFKHRKFWGVQNAIPQIMDTVDPQIWESLGRLVYARCTNLRYGAERYQVLDPSIK